MVNIHIPDGCEIQVAKVWDSMLQKYDPAVNPDSKVHGAYMGPTWGRQDPGGPHVGPMILAICESYHITCAADQMTLTRQKIENNLWLWNLVIPPLTLLVYLQTCIYLFILISSMIRIEMQCFTGKRNNLSVQCICPVTRKTIFKNRKS